ncbi:MAG: hypothetical protein AB2A00_15295, partial [Myxococcota bacterium]
MPGSALLPLLTKFLVATADAGVSDDVFDAFLRTEYPVADGFDFPVGDPDARGSYRDERTGRRHRGWYVAAGFLHHY